MNKGAERAEKEQGCSGGMMDRHAGGVDDGQGCRRG